MKQNLIMIAVHSAGLTMSVAPLTKEEAKVSRETGIKLI